MLQIQSPLHLSQNILCVVALLITLNKRLTVNFDFLQTNFEGKKFPILKKSFMTYKHGKYYFTQLYVGGKNSITRGLEKNIHSHPNPPQKSNGWSLMVKFISLFQLTNKINQQKLPHSCVPSCQGCKTFCSLSVAVHSFQAMGCSRSVSPIRHFLTQSLVFRLLNCLSIMTTIRHLRPQ